MTRQPRRHQADDDGIVAGQDQVNHDDLGERAQFRKRYQHRRITTSRSLGAER